MSNWIKKNNFPVKLLKAGCVANDKWRHVTGFELLHHIYVLTNVSGNVSILSWYYKDGYTLVGDSLKATLMATWDRKIWKISLSGRYPVKFYINSICVENKSYRKIRP